MQEVQVRSWVRKLRSHMLLSGVAKYMCVCVGVCVCVYRYIFLKNFLMKRKAVTPLSEDNSAHLEGEAGALGCVWKGPDLEQEEAQISGGC